MMEIVYDSFSMGVIAKSTFAKFKIVVWILCESKFVKRAGLAIISPYCMAYKKGDNRV